MNNKDNNLVYNNILSIIVYSCRRNSDMWPVFGMLFRKYWEDCPFRLILVTDYTDEIAAGCYYDDCLCIDGTWHNMISGAIEYCKSDYVMLMMDDYLLNDYVNEKMIYKVLDDAVRYDAANIRLASSDIHLKTSVFTLDSNYLQYEPGSAYSLSTHIGIWNSNILLRYMRPEWSAWDFERIGSLEICDRIHPILRSNEYLFPYIEGVRRGKWLNNGVQLCTKEGIALDFSVRKRIKLTEIMMINAKVIVYNINPTFIQKVYNYYAKILRKVQKQ